MDQYINIACTAALLLITFIMSKRYSSLRKDRKYSEGRDQTQSLSSYKNVSKVIFIIGAALTVTSFWSNSPLLLKVYNLEYLKLAGVLLALTGCLSLQFALSALGKNYSPLFDAFGPHEIVKKGPYKVIRHPVYSFNLMVTFGYTLASGSVWVLVYALIGLFHVVKALKIEEDFLQTEFPSYKEYMRTTWRMIPFVF